MKSKKIMIVHELSDEEKYFVLYLANTYKIPCDLLESYFRDLRVKIKGLLRSDDLIDNIDYNLNLPLKESKREKLLLTVHSQIILFHINSHWQILRRHAIIISGLIIMFYKLDKYKRIKTEDDYNNNPTDSAQDYNHYLFERMKTKFNRFKNTE